VVNPASAGGKAGRRWPRIATLLSSRIGAFEIAVTQHPGDAIEQTRAFLRAGFERIIAVGGDGTFNEIANAFLSEEHEACLGLVPVATAGDLTRALGIPCDPESAVEALAQSTFALVDAGRAAFVDDDGQRQERYFLNMLSFGLGGEVTRRVRDSRTPLGGTAAYLLHAASALLSTPPARVTLAIDGAGEEAFDATHVAIGNGRFHGGGMHLCPRARMDDGFLDVTVVHGIGLAELARNIHLVYNGRIYEHPKAEHRTAKRVLARADSLVRLEIDGEPLGRLPVEVEIVPACLRLLTHTAL
jgi:YegS/Rv2252/BmrU family lipid kinase